MPSMFRAIKADLMKLDAYAKPIKAAAERTKQGMLRDYQAGVATWRHPVSFESQVVFNLNGAVSVRVDTDDDIYTFVHEGTKEHIIRPRRARSLRFQSGYQAKTTPGAIKAGPGGSFGATVYSKGVMHPGSAARNFTKTIFDKWTPFWGREMKRALDEGASKSGHSI